eukprot:GHVS01049198.1.p1 GENE.GHVS01049198.1~~GHVS01049198.1.p1  ORF type:complete len:182 (+),score=31.22 GHVS01049198.1:168-713(+)
MIMLNNLVDPSKVECLNEHHEHTLQQMWKHNYTTNEGTSTDDNNSYYLSSTDDDVELLIKIGFRQPVKLSAIRFIPVCSSSSPNDVRLFINNMSLGFADAESDVSVQQLEISNEQIESAVKIPLRFVKFQSVSSLIIYVASNHGADFTKLKGIEIFGSPGELMDMNAWKPLKEEDKLAADD